MSIPSSPEVEDVGARFALVRLAENEDSLVGLIHRLRAAQHAASTQPLLAEIERLKGEKDTVFGWLEYEKQKAAAAEAEAQKLREALERIAGNPDPGYVEDLEAAKEGKVMWVHSAVAIARKALGGS